MTVWRWKVQDRWVIPMAVISGLVVGCLIIFSVTFSVSKALERTHSAEIDSYEYANVERWAAQYPEVKAEVITPRLADKKINRKEYGEIRDAVAVKKRQSILERLLRRP